MPDRTEREKLVRDLQRDAETLFHNGWEPEAKRVLAAAELLSEEGEPVAWEAETTEGGWWRYNATRRWTEQMVSGNSMFTGRIRPLYPGPVQEASDER